MGSLKFILILFVGCLLAGIASGMNCTLRVGAFESGQYGILKDGRPVSSLPLDSVVVKAISKSTQKAYLSYRNGELSYFEQLPEGDYRIILSKVGYETSYEPFTLQCEDGWSIVNQYFGLTKGSPKKVRNNDTSTRGMRENVKTIQGDSNSSYYEPVVTGGAPVYLPQVKLSPASLGTKFDGEVVVEVEIDTKGNVKLATAIKGHPRLIADCEMAAYYAVFSPKTLDGRSVPNFRTITYSFANGLPVAKPERNRTILGGVLNGKALSLPKPTYPAAAKALRASGTVEVEILIDESGNVVLAKAQGGSFIDMTTKERKTGAHPLLVSASESAARLAKFSPTLVDGNAVNVRGVITYTFIP